MSDPKSLKYLAQNPNNAYMTPNQQTKALLDATGKNLHELIAEIVAYERLEVMSGNKESNNYVKLLTSLLGKFAVGAPSTLNLPDPIAAMSIEEVKAKIANYQTRLELSNQLKKNTEDKDPKE